MSTTWRPGQLASAEVQSNNEATVFPLSARALVIGLLIVAVFTVAEIYAIYIYYEHLGSGYLPRGAMMVLVLLIGATLLVRFIARPLALRQHEVMAIFGMLVVAAAVPGYEFGANPYTKLLGLVYYHTPERVATTPYMDYLNPRLFPSLNAQDPVIMWAFEGKPEGAPIPYDRWLPVLAIWTPFWLGVFWTLACLAYIFFPRWEQHEKLLFPLTQVPIEMTNDLPMRVPTVLKNSLFWIGFGGAVLLYGMQGIHDLYPFFPYIKLDRRIGGFSGPWEAWNGVMLNVHPDMIGIAYLLSTEVSFSIWFFHQFMYLQHFLLRAFGWRQDLRTFSRAQWFGAHLALIPAIVWSSRG